MKNNKIKLIMIAIACVLVFIAASIQFDLFSGNKVNFVYVVDKLDKNAVIVDDGKYVYYTNARGDVMYVDPYDVENPQLWMENGKVIAVSDSHILIGKKDGVELYKKQEKTVEQRYNIKTSNAVLTDEGLYYLDDKTKNVMKLDNPSEEAVAIIPFEVKKFAMYENKIVYVPMNKKSGIITYDLGGSSAMMYAYEKTVNDFYVTNDGLLYYGDDDGKKIKYVRLIDNAEGVTEQKVKDSFGFCQGSFFYVKNPLFGKNKLVFDIKDNY